MRRRTLLAAACTVATAGCVGSREGPSPGSGGDGSGSDGSEGDSGSDGTETGDGTEDGERDEDPAEGGDGDPAVEPTDDPGLGDVTLARREPGDPGDADVAFDGGSVRVTGTVVGATGCHVPEIETAEMADDGEFRLVVAAVDDSGPDEACTQALTELGYLVEAEFGDGVPTAVTVVHDDQGGRRQVAGAEPDA